MFITIFSQKGGVGKTTTAINLAYYLARDGRCGFVVDLDRQQHHALLYDGSIPGVRFLSALSDLPPDLPEGVFIIVDSSPHITAETGPALLGADLILIPALPTGLGLKGVDETNITVRNLLKQNPDVGAMVFFSNASGLTRAKKRMDDYRTNRSIWPVMKTVIRRREGEHERAFDKCCPVSPNTDAGRDFLALAIEIEALF